MFYSGRFEEAISLAKRAIRLNPYCQSWYYMLYGASLRFAGRYQEAIEAHKKQLELAQKEKSNLFFPHSGLASAYALIGQEEKAQAHTKEALKIFPNASLEYARKITRFKNPAHLESHLNSLRKAGFPEHPPKE
jgi:tetratricopeptide (TPR) repeat protein